MTNYKLPDLPYDYSALEPHISGHIMELHHGKHHAAYVKSANLAIEQLAELRDDPNPDTTKLAGLERALPFNVSGHVLHCLFWRNLTPGGGGRPAGELLQAIARDLGGFERFQKQLSGVAATVMGSGWAALVWEPIGQRLVITQIHDHQSNMSQAGVPIMVIDAWEHAYYLQYENRKTEFFAAVWRLWNWVDVSERFHDVQKLAVDMPDATTAQLPA